MVVKNNSEKTFVDGDLVIDAGATAEVQEDRAQILLRDYAWQFEESSSKSAKGEEEIKQAQRLDPVAPTADGEFIKRDQEGKVSEKKA